MNHTTATTRTTPASLPAAPVPTGERTLHRRGLVAGAAALVAAALAAQPIAAASPLVGTNGTATITDPTAADGVQGYASGVNNAGVAGRNNDLNGLGVVGTAPSGIGVSGSSGTGPGVSGISTSNYGMFGTSTSGNGTGGISSTGYGLIGVATASSGYGLVAYNGATGGYGASFGGIVLVNGTQYVSSSPGAGYSLVAYTSTAGYYALEGIGNTAGAHGLYAAPGSGGVAAVLNGNVVVTGSLTVYGSYPKNAAVPHPDGSYRLLYCTESPEPWFEDFGVANLTGGKATVALDPDFATVAVTSGYHVFLTPRADCNGLAVTNQTASGFSVQELRGGTSTLSFSWRLAARRGDIAGERFAPFTPPTVVASPKPPAPLMLSPDLPVPAPPPQAPPGTPLKPGPPVTPVIPTATPTVVPMSGPTATTAVTATPPSTATSAPTAMSTVPSTAAPTPVPTTRNTSVPTPALTVPPATGAPPSPVATAVPRLTAAPMGAAVTSAPASAAATGSAATAGTVTSGTAGTGGGVVPNATPAPH